MYRQNTIAKHVMDNGIVVIVREGLNEKMRWELRLEIPKHLHALWTQDNFVYEKRGTLYFAEDKDTGRVRYFHYATPGKGFGGCSYHLPMVDGSTATLIGPWSSRCECMNEAGFTPSIEVNIAAQWNMADAMTIEAINTLLLPLEMECVVIDNSGYIIRL